MFYLQHAQTLIIESRPGDLSRRAMPWAVPGVSIFRDDILGRGEECVPVPAHTGAVVLYIVSPHTIVLKATTRVDLVGERSG